MNVHYFRSEEIKLAFFSVVICTLAFITFHFIIHSKNYRNFVVNHFGKKKARIYIVIIQRLLGVFLYGILPVLLLLVVFQNDLSDFGLNLKNGKTTLMWIGIISPIVLAMNFLNSGKKDNLAQYPQIRKKKWTGRLIVLSALSWTAYLFAYEFIFRGMLLFGLYRAMGTTMAIVINVSIYALVHVPKGIKESVGAIPLGIVLCILTLRTENIIIAFVVHVVMALSNEWFSLKAHPKMNLKSAK